MVTLSGKPEIRWIHGKFWEANSVADFWSKWNPVVHYSLLKLLRLVRRRLGTPNVVPPTILAIFLFEGLLHDFLVWCVGFGAWNPKFCFTSFFLMNGVFVIVERFSGVSVLLPTIIKKILTFTWIICSFWIALTLRNYFIRFATFP